MGKKPKSHEGIFPRLYTVYCMAELGQISWCVSGVRHSASIAGDFFIFSYFYFDVERTISSVRQPGNICGDLWVAHFTTY